MSTPAAAPSSAALLYLFADRVVERDTALSQKFEVPCTDAAVKQATLAAELFAIGFWSLQEQGKLTLSMGKRTLMGMGRQQITASIQPGVDVRPPPQGPQVVLDVAQLQASGGLLNMLGNLAQQVPEPAPLEPGQTPFTLEDSTLHLVEFNGGTAPVRDIIQSWFGSDEPNPSYKVIQRVGRELIELGYSTGTTGGSLMKTPTITIDCGRRASLEGPAIELLERWAGFRDAPDGLGTTLVDRCRAAISSMQESDE
ncbi:MAG TPA: hypothetical protein VF660_04680 [Actinomycetota bacterium]|jgi:hypothetical protein